MYTQCPQCQTYFQVTPEHLKIAQGNVRCGQCRHVFNALGNLSERPPEVHRPPLEEDEFAEFDEYPEQDAPSDPVPAKPSAKAKAKVAPKRAVKSRQNAPPAPQTAKPAAPTKGAVAAGLSQAIQAINALKRVNKPLNSLEAGREAILAKLKTTTGDDKNTPAPRAPTKAATAAESAAAKIASVAIKLQDPPSVQPNPVNTPVNFDPDSDFESEFHDPFIHPSEPVADIDFDAALRAIDELELSEEAQQQAPQPSNAKSNKSEPKIKPLARTQREQQAPQEPAKRRVVKRAAPSVVVKPVAKSTNTLPAVIPYDDNIPTITDIPPQLRADFTQEQTEHLPPPHWSNYLWVSGSVLLMMIFLLQTVYFKHDDLGRNPALHSWIELFCKPLNCSVALPIDISRLELLGQDIRSHPKSKEALLVNTTIINNAPYVQAYPGLLLTFSDMNGRKIAMRRFSPAEYLNRSVNRRKGMLPDAPVQIELEIFDPGSNAVNFEFDFFPYAE